MSGILRFAQSLAVLVALFAAATTARASNGWLLVQAVGDVRITAPTAQPISTKPSTPVPDGATVRTGGTGRAVLLRGRETIVMSPSSVVTLPAGLNRDVSRVKQESGHLLFKIGKKPEAHFEVDTPYLAAVVKGTTFTVKVSADAASVHVLEGAVEVATSNRKHSFLTRAGQISTVFAKAANDIFTTGASLLNGPSGSTQLWGTDVSDFEFAGESAWTVSGDDQVFKSSGLKARADLAERKDEALTERAPKRLALAAKAVSETMSAAKESKRTEVPKSARVRTSEAPDARGRENGYDENRDLEGKRDGSQTLKSKNNDAKARAIGPTHKVPNVWTVTQAKGDIEIDGYAFTAFGDGLVRSLPPGTLVGTGPNSRLGVAHGMSEFIIEANSLVVLGDPNEDFVPKVVSGMAVTYREQAGRYDAVANLSPEEVAELRAQLALDVAPSKEKAESAVRVAAGGSRSATVKETSIPMPKPVMPSAPVNPKTEEARTKVIGGLTLGLYGLAAILVLAFSAQWIWRRYRSKAKEPAVETPAQARLRNIKGS